MDLGCGHVHYLQHSRRHEYADRGEQDSEQERYCNRRVDGVLHPILPLCAVVLADDNARARGEPHKETYQQIDYGPYVPDGRKRGIAHVIPDDPRINGVIKLLKEISKHQRDGELYEQRDDPPLRHIHIAL